MENDYLNFKKQRELGEIINDTFKFLRENYKLLFTLILKIAGPAFLILIVSAGYYMYATMNTFSILETSTPFENMIAGNFELFVLAALVMFASLLIYTTLLSGTVLNFIKSYIKNKGEVNEHEVGQDTRSDFWKLFGGGLLTGIMVFFGLLVCFFPGIYLMVPLSLIFAVLIFDKLSIGDSISHCFVLIKDNWWITFATLLIMWILVYIIGIVFSIPAIIYTLTKSLTMATETSGANIFQTFDWVYVALNLIGTIAQYLLYTITIISTGFIYFNLNEKKNFTGTLESIDNLGNREQ